MEDCTPLELRNLSLHSAPDIVVREFDHAYVIVKPSLNDEALNLKTIFPSMTLPAEAYRWDKSETLNDENIIIQGRSGIIICK